MLAKRRKKLHGFKISNWANNSTRSQLQHSKFVKCTKIKDDIYSVLALVAWHKNTSFSNMLSDGTQRLGTSTWPAVMNNLSTAALLGSEALSLICTPTQCLNNAAKFLPSAFNVGTPKCSFTTELFISIHWQCNNLLLQANESVISNNWLQKKLLNIYIPSNDSTEWHYVNLWS